MHLFDIRTNERTQCPDDSHPARAGSFLFAFTQLNKFEELVRCGMEEQPSKPARFGSEQRRPDEDRRQRGYTLGDTSFHLYYNGKQSQWHGFVETNPSPAFFKELALNLSKALVAQRATHDIPAKNNRDSVHGSK